MITRILKWLGFEKYVYVYTDYRLSSQELNDIKQVYGAKQAVGFYGANVTKVKIRYHL
jgi:hypothetical protein